MRNKIKLKKRLNFSYIVAVILPMIIIITVGIIFTSSFLKDISKDAHRQVISNLGQAVDAFFKTPIKDMANLRESLTKLPIDDYDIIVPDYFNNQDFFHHYLIADRQGSIVYSYPHDASIIGFDYSYENSFVQISDTVSAAWSKPYIYTKENKVSMNYALKSGNYVIIGIVHLELLQNIFDETVSLSNYSVSLLDQTNTYLAHTDYSLVEQRQQSTIEFTEDKLFEKVRVNYKNYYVTTTLTDYLNWKIIIMEPSESVNNRLRDLVLLLGGLSVLLLVITTVFGFKLNENVFKNIKVILDKTREVQDGRYSINMDVNPYEEFDQIRINFLSMLEEIKLREDQILSQNYEIEVMNKDLENRVIERTNDLYAANQELEIALDNLKLTQDQLVESEKLASLGDLVAGLAHEINTPLGIILTVITYLQETTKQVKKSYDTGMLKKSDFENYIHTHVDSEDLIYDNVSKAIELISSFKLISAEQRNVEKRVVDVKEFITSIVKSVEPKLKKEKVVLNLHIKEDLELETIPIALYQIIVNLVLNAKIHAYDSEGGIIDLFVNKESNYLELIVQDYGEGIDEAHIKKIFEPFFTTKRGAGGTGLGLNIVYNTVKQNLKGEIRCYSELGVGTQFIIHLPYQI